MYIPVWHNNIFSVIPLLFSFNLMFPSESHPSKIFTAFNSGRIFSKLSTSSNFNFPCSASCIHAIPVTILVQLAIQKTESRVIGFGLEIPRKPEAWETRLSPAAFVATKTTPGMELPEESSSVRIVSDVFRYKKKREGRRDMTLFDGSSCCLGEGMWCHGEVFFVTSNI